MTSKDRKKKIAGHVLSFKYWWGQNFHMFFILFFITKDWSKNKIIFDFGILPYERNIIRNIIAM